MLKYPSHFHWNTTRASLNSRWNIDVSLEFPWNTAVSFEFPWNIAVSLEFPWNIALSLAFPWNKCLPYPLYWGCLSTATLSGSKLLAKLTPLYELPYIVLSRECSDMARVACIWVTAELWSFSSYVKNADRTYEQHEVKERIIANWSLINACNMTG